jgi:hypothetical protein
MIREMLACLLLTACVSKPLTAEYREGGDVIVLSDRRVSLVNEAAMPRHRRDQLKQKWLTPSYDAGERAAFKRLMLANVADLATTAAFLQAGCREANPMMRHPGALVGLKAAWLLWWRYEASRSPEGFSHAGDDKYALAFYGAAAINLRAATNGCVLW